MRDCQHRFLDAGSRASDQDARNEYKHATDNHLKSCLQEGRIHKAGPDP
jgi:hypothetical protein